MVHLPPLPGSPFWRGERLAAIVERSKRDAEALLEEGLDGYLIENFGDAPFFPERVPPHVLTMMTRIALALPRAGLKDSPAIIGVNVLRNDALGALAVAAAAGLDLIRVNVHSGAMVTDQGIIEGRAAETLRARSLLATPVAILADVLVKHAEPLAPRSLKDPGAHARELVERAGADALVVTGPATGAPTDFARLRAVSRAVPGHPLFAGSGVTPRTVGRILEIADGAIIGTALKVDGDVRSPVDPRRVRAMVRAAGRD
jgi:hypothetical protein